MDIKKLNELINQPNNVSNVEARYNASSGRMAAMQAKPRVVRRSDLIKSNKSKDLEALKNQIDYSFKMILNAADNTGSVEMFIISKLNATKKLIFNRIDSEIKRSSK